MSKGIKLAAWERTHGPVNYDHRPALFERQFDTETNDTIPPANDPNYIEPVSVKQHDIRTNGIGGEKRITTAGSDANRRAKARRLTAEQEAFQHRVLTKPCGQKREPTGRWPQGRKLQSGNDLRRR